MEKVFENIKECCGCGHCADVCPKGAIEMTLSGGYTYPKIDGDKCIDCGLCRRACQFIKREEKKLSPECFAARINEDSIRLKSSSGGAFTVLSDAVLDCGGAVCGAVFSEDMSVRHIVTDNKTDRDRMRGAKYVQSDMSGAYRDMEAVLKEGKTLLFTGTPCQVAAVKARFKKYEENLITIDLICHGVPAREVWDKYIEYVESVYKKKVVNFTFRDKQKSWRTYHAVVTFEDGTTLCDTAAIDSYVELFRYDVSLRPACTACPYASTVREGDITVGDFWGLEKVFPQMDDDRGVSALILNTEKGKSFLPMMREKMWLESCEMENVTARQPNMTRPSKPSSKYDEFMSDLETLPFSNVLKKYTNVGFKRKAISLVKKLLKKQ